MAAAYHASAHATLDQPSLSPPPSLAAGAAYDVARGALVVVGGASPTAAAETWIWSNVRWRRVISAGPSPRAEPLLAYASDRSRIVLYGGDRGRDLPPLTDTWSYDGRAWSRLLDGGPARGRHRLVYDPDRRTVLLYGGYDGRRRTSELWALRANAWERLAP